MVTAGGLWRPIGALMVTAAGCGDRSAGPMVTAAGLWRPLTAYADR
jgi:hypothetical protein